MEGSFSNPGYHSFDLIEEGRRDIFKWSEKRRSKRSGFHGSLYKITKLFITRSLVRSFMHNLSVVVLFQMFLGAICTYACVKLGLEMDVHMSLFVSPIVFPLAFSINANYQRRESVLEDLAMFKSSSSILFFCHRDWIKAAELPVDLLKTLSNKLKFLVINIREYLLTEDSQKRKFILQAIYEDLSDVAQLNDKIRTSLLKSNSALVARIIHCHNLMCWSFERLRVIREYSSPRSLRAFTKVFIFLMPLLLSPYYVFSGRQTESSWTPYFISIMVSFLFGSLQSVQDKLDDPFDGIGEDDVKLGQLDDWTTQSLLTNRTVTIGRFTVTTTTAQEERSPTPIPPLQQNSSDENSPMRPRHTSLGDVESPKKSRRFMFNPEGSPKGLHRILSRKGERNPEGRRSNVAELDESKFTDQLESRCHGIASKLEGLSGTSIILPGNRIPYIYNEYQGLKSPETVTTPIISKPSENRLAVSGDGKKKNASSLRLDNRLPVVRESDEETSDIPSSPETLPEIFQNMKSDAVVRPGESNTKRPTVLGLFSSPEGNTDEKVSDNAFTPTEETSSSSATNITTSNTTEITTPKTDKISSEDLPLLPQAPASQDESGSDIEANKTSCSTPEQQHHNEPSTSCGNTTDETKGGSSEPDGPAPKLRFCLPGKRGARGDRGRFWGRRQKKKRSHLKEKCESDVELAGTTSMSPLLPLGVNQYSEKETESLEPSLSVSRNSQDGIDIDNGSTNDGITTLEVTGDGSTNRGNVETGNADHEPTDFRSTDQITSVGSETDCNDSKPLENIREDDKPKIVVSLPVEEESSLWDFDVSSDKIHDNNIDGTTNAKEDNSNSIEPAQPQNNLDSISSTEEMPKSENNVSPEPEGSRFSVSKNNEENTGISKPRSSRFTVSPS